MVGEDLKVKVLPVGINSQAHISLFSIQHFGSRDCPKQTKKNLNLQWLFCKLSAGVTALKNCWKETQLLKTLKPSDAWSVSLLSKLKISFPKTFKILLILLVYLLSEFKWKNQRQPSQLIHHFSYLHFPSPELMARLVFNCKKKYKLMFLALEKYRDDTIYLNHNMEFFFSPEGFFLSYSSVLCFWLW